MFTVLLKVATYNIVKGHNLLMHEFCYVDIVQEARISTNTVVKQ